MDCCDWVGVIILVAMVLISAEGIIEYVIRKRHKK